MAFQAQRPCIRERAILLIGGKKNYREIVEAFTSNPYSEFHVMGIGIIDAKENEIPNYHGFPVFCGESAIEDFAQLNWVDEALFSIPTELPLPDKMIKNFGIMGITIHIKLARVADDSSNQIVEKLEGYTVLSTSINMVSAGQLIFKRTMDICGGLVGMLLTGIIFIFVAPIIYIKSPGPIFFKQVRIGKNGKKFNIYKFRSMYMDAEERKKELMAQNDIKDGMMFKMDNDPRIIKGIGNFIRDYSLDEFPQFWNVLIGDMSLVGTRPPTVDEWEKYEMHHRSRLAFKPGLTGMWQVSGRSNITDLLDVSMLTAMSNSMSVGYYSNSTKIVKAVANTLTGISAVLMPRFSYLFSENKKDEIKKLSGQFLNVTFLISIPCCIGIILTANQIVEVLFGGDFTPAIATIRILAALIVLMPLSGGVFCQLLLTSGKEKYYLFCVLSGTVVNALLNYVLIPIYTQNGAAIASVIAELTVSVMTTLAIIRSRFA